MQNTDAPDDTTITQRFAEKLMQIGITSEVVGDDLTVTVEGVQIGAHIDDYTPFGEMWRLNLWVDVGEVDDAAAAAAAEVVQSVVAMYGRRLLKGVPPGLIVPTSDQCEAMALVFDEKSVRAHAMWHPQWGGYAGKCLVSFHTGTKGCFDVDLWHDGDFPREDGPPINMHYCDPGQLIRFARRIVKVMRDGGVDVVDPVESAEKRVAELEAENARLRAALRQVEMAARFPDASDAWDQVRDGVSVLNG